MASRSIDLMPLLTDTGSWIGYRASRRSNLIVRQESNG